MLIREETESDWDDVYALNTSAFGTSAEADLVNTLREHARPTISLVAETGHRIVGHIMFSPVSLSGHSELKIMGLAPMAVAPASQQQGIGTALVRAGLQQCEELGFGAVVVLGHPDYYPRFGFLPAERFGIASEYDVPEGVFMTAELQPGYLRDASGIVEYHEAFSRLE